MATHVDAPIDAQQLVFIFSHRLFKRLTLNYQVFILLLPARHPQKKSLNRDPLSHLSFNFASIICKMLVLLSLIDQNGKYLSLSHLLDYFEHNYGITVKAYLVTSDLLWRLCLWQHKASTTEGRLTLILAEYQATAALHDDNRTQYLVSQHSVISFMTLLS